MGRHYLADHCVDAPTPPSSAVLDLGLEMSSLLTRRTVQAALAILAGTASSALAQQPAPGSAATAPDTGQMAPDFTLPGATRYGLLKDPIRLSNFRGQTVVLAFFPKARTKG
jgi:thioredoxin-dependent peroxiredoxin